ncbi:MAG: hypothetical protein IPM29_05000 [Planctomycetes bacterium]|nr:hypothetical protein [Planctomycetota bacterium]
MLRDVSIALIALISCATAQSNEPLFAVPAGISVSEATAASFPPLVPGGPVQKAGGAPAIVTAYPSTASLPPTLADFSILPTAVRASIDIDAMSIGADFIVVEPTGDGWIPDPLPDPRWAFLALSVRRGAVARDDIERESGDNGADVFGYYYPGSEGIPEDLVDHPRLGQDDDDMGLAETAEVDAIDINMSAYTHPFSPMNGDDHDVNYAPTFYFSVASARLTRVPLWWWGGTSPSGATILSTTWDPNTRAWSEPLPFLAYSALGLSSGDELDALAVDEEHSCLLFSTQGAAPADQIRFARFTAAGTATVSAYRFRSTGRTMGTAIGLRGTDDVDGVCVTDPRGHLLGNPRNGSRINLLPITICAPELRMTMFRTRSRTGTYPDGLAIWSNRRTASVDFVVLTAPGLPAPIGLVFEYLLFTTATSSGKEAYIDIPLFDFVGGALDFQLVGFVPGSSCLDSSRLVRLQL